MRLVPGDLEVLFRRSWIDSRSMLTGWPSTLTCREGDPQTPPLLSATARIAPFPRGPEMGIERFALPVFEPTLFHRLGMEWKGRRGHEGVALTSDCRGGQLSRDMRRAEGVYPLP